MPLDLAVGSPDYAAFECAFSDVRPASNRLTCFIFPTSFNLINSFPGVTVVDKTFCPVFEYMFKQIVARMNTFVSLPIPTLDEHAIEREMNKIGATPV